MMRRMTILSSRIGVVLLALLLLVGCIGTKNQTENVFYINTQQDFDRYSGTTFPSGSKILFATGRTFDGQFIIHGSGTIDKPNLVTAYNPEDKRIYNQEIDNKPIIRGNGSVQSPILLYNGENWEINNLELTNTNGTIEDQGDLIGIHIVGENSGELENVTVRNCYIHDVNGHVGGKKRGGIHIHVKGDSLPTKFQNLLIENNWIENVGGVGIGNASSWPDIDEEGYFPWTGVVIRGNRVVRTGRNGIIVRYSVDPLVEYNTLAYNSRYSTGHSVFNFNTIGCIVQYNEAYGNTSDNPEDGDRGGFDADFNSVGTIIQYNYSHDNNWFCGIMRRGVNKDVTIRYNISQNDLMGAYFYGFPGDDDLRDVKIYNNTHYFGKGKGSQIFVSAGRVRIPMETIFKNNIFFFEDPAQWGFEPDETCVFENNLFYNVSPRGKHAKVDDPKFRSPGTGGTDIDMRDLNKLSGYQLQKNSPAFSSGVYISGNGGKDFWGNPLVSDPPDIGAAQQ